MSVTTTNVNSGDTGLQARTKINTNDTDLATAINALDLWQEITGFTATAPAVNQITMGADYTATIKKGYGIKYQSGGVYYYAIVEDIDAATLTIGGVEIPPVDITELFWCDDRNVEIIDFALADASVQAVDTDILPSVDNNNPIELKDSYLVYVKVWAQTVDTGATKASLKFMNGANPVFGAGDGVEMTSNATWNDSGVDADPDYYKFEGFDNFRVDVTEPGTNNDTEGAKFTAYFILIG